METAPSGNKRLLSYARDSRTCFPTPYRLYPTSSIVRSPADDDDDSFTSGTFTTTSGTDDTHSGGYVEASTKTTVSVTASAYDERPGGESGGQGCGQHGCKPALAYDGISYDVESRWSCSKEIVHDEGQCEIEFTFEHPQDIVEMQVALWKGDERPRFLKVSLDTDGLLCYRCR